MTKGRALRLAGEAIALKDSSVKAAESRQTQCRMAKQWAMERAHRVASGAELTCLQLLFLEWHLGARVMRQQQESRRVLAQQRNHAASLGFCKAQRVLLLHCLMRWHVLGFSERLA